MNIFQFVEVIKAKPGMYIEGQSATELDSYIRGFIAAGQNYETFTDDSDQYYKFNKWVCEKYSIDESVSWRRAIQFMEPNDYFAFQKFFNLWDEWLDEESDNTK